MGFMLGSSCSACCPQGPQGPCPCLEGSLPDTVTVTLEGTGREPGPNRLGLSITSCFGTGATGAVSAPGGDFSGPISSATVTNGGSGYAKLGRTAPTLTLANAAEEPATVTFNLSQQTGSCGLPYWAISSVTVTDGGDGYVNDQALSISIAGGDTQEVAATGKIFTAREEPTLEASGGGIATFNVTVASNGDTPETWGVTGVTFSGETSGWTDGESLTFSGDGVTEGQGASVQVFTGRSEPEVFAEAETGSGAVIEATLTQTVFAPSPGEWQVSALSIVDGGEGYQVGNFVDFYRSDFQQYGGYGNVTAVDENGAITEVALSQVLGIWASDDIIESIVVNSGGKYFDPTPALGSVTITNGGRFFREDASLPALVANVTVSVVQPSGGSGSGAVIAAEVEDNPASPDFGKIVDLSITNGGSGYVSFQWIYSCDCEWVAGEEAGSSHTVVAWRVFDYGLEPTCLYEVPRCYPKEAPTITSSIQRRVKPPDTASVLVPGPGLLGGPSGSGGELRFQWTKTVVEGSLDAWVLTSVSVESAGTGYTNGTSFSTSGMTPAVVGTLTSNESGAIQSVNAPTDSTHWAFDGTSITVQRPVTAERLVIVRLVSPLKTAFVALLAPLGVPGRDNGPIQGVPDVGDLGDDENPLLGWATIIGGEFDDFTETFVGGEVYAPAVTATIEQVLPSQGSGAEVAVEVDNNRYSDSFGMLTIVLTNPGDGYLGDWAGTDSVVVEHRGVTLPPRVYAYDLDPLRIGSGGACFTTYTAAEPILDCDDFSFVASFGEATATVTPGGDATTMFRGSRKCCGGCYNCCPDRPSQVAVTFTRESEEGFSFLAADNAERDYSWLEDSEDAWSIDCPQHEVEVVLDLEDLELNDECPTPPFVICVGEYFEPAPPFTLSCDLAGNAVPESEAILDPSTPLPIPNDNPLKPQRSEFTTAYCELTIFSTPGGEGTNRQNCNHSIQVKTRSRWTSALLPSPVGEGDDASSIRNAGPGLTRLVSKTFTLQEGEDCSSFPGNWDVSETIAGYCSSGLAGFPCSFNLDAQPDGDVLPGDRYVLEAVRDFPFGSNYALTLRRVCGDYEIDVEFS